MAIFSSCWCCCFFFLHRRLDSVFCLWDLPLALVQCFQKHGGFIKSLPTSRKWERYGLALSYTSIWTHISCCVILLHSWRQPRPQGLSSPTPQRSFIAPFRVGKWKTLERGWSILSLANDSAHLCRTKHKAFPTCHCTLNVSIDLNQLTPRYSAETSLSWKSTCHNNLGSLSCKVLKFISPQVVLDSDLFRMLGVLLFVDVVLLATWMIFHPPSRKIVQTEGIHTVSWCGFPFSFSIPFCLFIHFNHCVVRCSCASLSYRCTDSPGLTYTISFNPRLLLTNFKCMILAVISTYVWDSNPDICDAGEVLYQLSPQGQLRTGGFVGRL